MITNLPVAEFHQWLQCDYVHAVCLVHSVSSSQFCRFPPTHSQNPGQIYHLSFSHSVILSIYPPKNGH